MSNYIIINLCAGLGNRLFQFAVAYAYSKKHNKKLIFQNTDKVIYNSHSNMNYNIIFFNDIERITFNNNEQINKYNELSYCHYEEIEYIDGNIILCGYYQTEKYFNDFKDDIFRRYSCKIPISKFENKYKYINNACFIHIRRGDYLNSKYDIGLIKKGYYDKCILDMENKYKDNDNDIHFYIISNDNNWCKTSLLFNKDNMHNMHIVEANELESLWLMQLCKYGGICANSTYSWWGGWLNKYHNKDSLIYFPNRITTDNLDYTDMYADGFTIINID
jgi:hypothetical protein